ncbi:MAG: major facilitator superfamily domain-containing protein 1 [Planctomycetes bacterium]|nr:major facilitator superfamily domain-containing protein 1 [Planctomycetota bacterium]
MSTSHDLESEVSKNIEERRYRREVIESKIRLFILIIFAVAGLGLVFFGCFLVYTGRLEAATNALVFIITGIASLAFGSSVALGKQATAPLESLLRPRSGKSAG